MKLIRKSQYRRMPWKNGQGFTDEIAISPDGAAFPNEPFVWRLSAATISTANTFSQFPGYDRWLAILRGPGLVLDGKPLRLGECVRFAGEETFSCAPIADEVTDIGLIFDRVQIDAQMERKSFIRGQHRLELRTGFHFMICTRGRFECRGLHVETGDTLQAAATSSFAIESGDAFDIFLISMAFRNDQLNFPT